MTSRTPSAALAKINASTHATRVTLTRIAAHQAPATKVAAKAVLKSAGLRQTLADALLSETARIAALRTIANTARIARHLGYCPVDATAARFGRGHIRPPIPARTINSSPGRSPVRLPGGTPQSRLDAARVATIASQLRASVRIGANDQVAIVLASDPTTIGLTQSECTDWDKYRGKFKGWACTYKMSTLAVPADWRVRVAARGLAMVDGMMTLDAGQLEATGCELYAATWLLQRRGNVCEAVRGYIARSGAITYHAATADQALSGIARKARELAYTARLDAADLGELVARCAGVQVSVGDARAVGACSYGIMSWCAAVGLDVMYDESSDTISGSATLGEVYTAYQREPRTEARATILRVLRRQRSSITA